MAVFTKVGRSIPSSATVPVAGDDSLKARLVKWALKKQINSIFQIPSFFSMFSISGHDPEGGKKGTDVFWPPDDPFVKWLDEQTGRLLGPSESGVGAQVFGSAFADP